MKIEASNKQTRARLLLSAWVLIPFCLMAQPRFRVYPSVEATAEGGDVSILVIQTDNGRFEVRVPKNYGAQVRQSDQSVVFTSQTGSSVITMTLSTNYAGALPKMEELRDTVARKYATASLVQTSSSYTGLGQGLLFDLFQPVNGGLTLRIRDAFVPFAGGSFEFTLSCDAREYDKNRLSFAWLLNSFRPQAEPAKENP